MNVKDLITKVFEHDKLLQEAFAAIKESAPSFTDLFKGAFKDKLQVLIKGFATFFVVFSQKAMADSGMTEDQLIDRFADYMDEKVTLPWWAEYVDGIIFHFLITYAVNYVKAESTITVAYQQAFDAVQAETA
jgi:hypothetical protein